MKRNKIVVRPNQRKQKPSRLHRKLIAILCRTDHQKQVKNITFNYQKHNYSFQGAFLHQRKEKLWGFDLLIYYFYAWSRPSFCMHFILLLSLSPRLFYSFVVSFSWEWRKRQTKFYSPKQKRIHFDSDLNDSLAVSSTPNKSMFPKYDINITFYGSNKKKTVKKI